MTNLRRLYSLTAYILLFVADLVEARPPERYVNFELLADSLYLNSKLKVVLSNGRSRLMPRDVENRPQFSDPQSDFVHPVISPDGSRIGWIASYPDSDGNPINPLPLTLIIYKNGRIEARLRGIGLPIFNWRFNDSGDQVTFCQRPTHGGGPNHYVRQTIGHTAPDEQADWDEAEDAIESLPAWAAAIPC